MVDREPKQAVTDESASAGIAFKNPFADTTQHHPASNDNDSSRSDTKSPTSPLNDTSGPYSSRRITPSLGVQQLLSNLQPRDPLADQTPAPTSDTVAYNSRPSLPHQLQKQQHLDHLQANTGHYTSPSGDNTQTYDTRSAAPHHHSIKPIATAVMAFEKARKFSTGTSVHRKRQMSTLVEKEGHFGPALTVSTLPTTACLTASTFHANIGCPVDALSWYLCRVC